MMWFCMFLNHDKIVGVGDHQECILTAIIKTVLDVIWLSIAKFKVEPEHVMYIIVHFLVVIFIIDFIWDSNTTSWLPQSSSTNKYSSN
jgi:hypothetical protein